MIEDTTPLRFNLISEVALAEGETARPIHMLRTGTFTSMSGREFTFTPEHFAQMVANFKAGKRRKPPITENHDFGRAVGRLIDLWTDGNNLYGLPKWTKAGRDLVADEVYDGFSSEVNVTDSIIIGGSLTNYPAVDGLEPVTLSAPPFTQQDGTQAGGSDPAVSLPATESMYFDAVEKTRTIAEELRAFTAPLAPPSQARADTQPQPTQEHIAMSEENTQDAEVTPPTLPPLQPPQFTASDPAVQAQVNAVVAQMTAQFEAQRQVVLEQAQAQFQRQLAEMQARQQIDTYAQHVTTPTMQRQHALPFEAGAVSAFLSGLNAGQRQTAIGLFDRILDAGLVSFEEIGTSGGAEVERSAKDDFDAAVLAKVESGMTRLAAMQAVQRDNPDLYARYRKEGK